MKFRKIILSGFFISAITLNFQSQCGNRIEEWIFGPSNNDPRLIGLTVAGTASTVIGGLLVKKGIEQTFAPSKENQHSFPKPGWWITCSKNIASRAFGSIITVLGTGLALGGIGLLIGNKDLITEYNKYTSGFYN